MPRQPTHHQLLPTPITPHSAHLLDRERGPKVRLRVFWPEGDGVNLPERSDMDRVLADSTLVRLESSLLLEPRASCTIDATWRFGLPSSTWLTFAPNRRVLTDSGTDCAVGERLTIINVFPLPLKAGSNKYLNHKSRTAHRTNKQQRARAQMSEGTCNVPSKVARGGGAVGTHVSVESR